MEEKWKKKARLTDKRLSPGLGKWYICKELYQKDPGIEGNQKKHAS